MTYLFQGKLSFIDVLSLKGCDLAFKGLSKLCRVTNIAVSMLM